MNTITINEATITEAISEISGTSAIALNKNYYYAALSYTASHV